MIEDPYFACKSCVGLFKRIAELEEAKKTSAQKWSELCDEIMRERDEALAKIPEAVAEYRSRVADLECEIWRLGEVRDGLATQHEESLNIIAELRAEIERLRTEVNERRAQPLICAMWRPGEDGEPCGDCEPCRKRAEVERLKAGYLDRTPDGTGLCYLHDGQLVLIGRPVDADDEESGHNCDEMGCSSVSHVVERHRLTPAQVERLCGGDVVGVSEILNPPAKEEP